MPKVNSLATLEKPVRLFGSATVGKDCHMGRFSYMNDKSTLYEGTKVGRFCSIGKKCEIGVVRHPLDRLSTSPVSYHLAFHFPDQDGLFPQVEFDRFQTTTIGSDVWIGSMAVVVRGITIGHGSVIGAGSIVTKDVPPYAIVGGSPAKIIRYRFSEDIIERLLASEWWNLPADQLAEIDFVDVEKALKQLEALKSSSN